MSTATAPIVRHGRTGLAGQLSELGVERNGVLLVHASIRAVGTVGGGVGAVVGALRDALGEHGTLVVPAFTPENSDTSAHYLDRVRGLTDQAREAVRASMPPFDAATSAAPSMGRLAEAVRLTEEAVRSGHPQTSFAALGPLARNLVADHRSDCHLGEDSPLARLYDLRAQVLLLGTGFDTCTAFHLGEYRVPVPPRRSYRCVVTTEGRLPLVGVRGRRAGRRRLRSPGSGLRPLGQRCGRPHRAGGRVDEPAFPPHRCRRLRVPLAVVTPGRVPVRALCRTHG